MEDHEGLNQVDEQPAQSSIGTFWSELKRHRETGPGWNPTEIWISSAQTPGSKYCWTVSIKSSV